MSYCVYGGLTDYHRNLAYCVYGGLTDYHRNLAYSVYRGLVDYLRNMSYCVYGRLTDYLRNMAHCLYGGLTDYLRNMAYCVYRGLTLSPFILSQLMQMLRSEWLSFHSPHCMARGRLHLIGVDVFSFLCWSFRVEFRNTTA